MKFFVVIVCGLLMAAHAWAGDFRNPDQHITRSSHPGSFAPPTTGNSVLLGNGSGGFSSLSGNTLSAHNFATQITSGATLLGRQPTAADIAAGTFSGTDMFSSAPQFLSITGSTQCLQVNSAGLVSGTGALCGTGGGGGGLPTQLTTTDANGNVAWVQGATGVNFKYYTAMSGTVTMVNYGGL